VLQGAAHLMFATRGVQALLLLIFLPPPWEGCRCLNANHIAVTSAGDSGHDAPSSTDAAPAKPQPQQDLLAHARMDFLWGETM